ncbi:MULTISPECIES: hypothetical protein [Burkholderia]|uniref:hypothetical protein n=1 Tax=Burkholderia TaxID=32008 RepID=UPI00073AA556|nr:MULTISPECIES: hypothetical protein [Burkholderia]ALV61651.1 hypothetical protein TQ36_36100 [Burkholderia cenocepacia]AQQ48088.1 hypothetical protein A8F32_19680 [Burkholderia cenocepacia]ONJ04194.1 hypothetical protein A8F33_23820 [Burkholderia cenocepacia]ONJ09536.1 hypothetical protein A8F53_00770 [Burkholderia cenocepacia]ONJ29277.1 hypothetical protein A8F38_17430 [Burkholderia cenocepacia]
MIAAPMLEQRDTMVALGWTVVSDYGYSHASGWTIGVCRVHDKWVVELWDGRSLHATVDSPVAAARLHREIIAGANSNTRDDVDDQHAISS